MTKKKIKIEFAPGAFDDFEGTQEELNELVAEIQRLADTGELFKNSQPLTDETFEELSDRDRQIVLDSLSSTDDGSERTLQ